MKAEGLEHCSVRARNLGAAQAYGDGTAHVVEVLSGQLGPLQQPNLTVAQLPDGTLPSYAAPGLLLISQRQWTTPANEHVLANLVASQWWGDQVMAASTSDQWLTDGLKGLLPLRRSMWKKRDGKGALDKLIDEFAIGSMMYEGRDSYFRSSAPFAILVRLQFRGGQQRRARFQ